MTQQADDDSSYDDLNTSSITGDSGFADSNDFLKVSLSGQYHPPPQAPYTSRQEGSDPDICYAPLNMEAVHAGYYKSLHREGIQGTQVHAGN